MADTHVQLFRHSRPLATPVMGEACLALIRNDDAVMNLLIAEAARWDDQGLLLEQVIWFCAHADRSATHRLAAVHLRPGSDDIWRAIDRSTRKLIPRPSSMPYHVLFIDDTERQRLHNALDTDNDLAVFNAAQQHFGGLPGFDSAEGMLISPPGYATSDVGISDDFLPE